MKRLIRKILNEEIHPDYEGIIDEKSAYFKPSTAELKIGLLVLKKMVTQDKKYSSDWAYMFKKELKNEFAINDNEIITRMLLIFFFNNEKELEYSLKHKTTDNLYIGPFYECVMDYNESNTDEQYESISCDSCSGSGTEEETCTRCDGSGEIESYGEEGEDEWETCDECGGSGEVDIDCSWCGGSGEQEERTYVLSQFSSNIISKEPFDTEYFRDASDVLYNTDFLVSSGDWYDEQREYDYHHLQKFEDEIIEIHSEDILQNNESSYVAGYF